VYPRQMRPTSVPPVASFRGGIPDSLVARTLLAAARQRPGLDEMNCQFVLEWMQIGAMAQDVLRDSLARFGLTEAKFSILVALFTLDPDPVMEADLANHAGVTRPSVTNALHELQEQGLVGRTRNTVDRRVINVHITKKGHATIDAAIQHYLETAEHLARFVDRDVQAAATTLCDRLILSAKIAR